MISAWTRNPWITISGWITVTFSSDIHGPQRRDAYVLDNPLISPQFFPVTLWMTFQFFSQISWLELLDTLVQTFMLPLELIALYLVILYFDVLCSFIVICQITGSLSCHLYFVLIGKLNSRFKDVLSCTQLQCSHARNAKRRYQVPQLYNYKTYIANSSFPINQIKILWWSQGTPRLRAFLE